MRNAALLVLALAACGGHAPAAKHAADPAPPDGGPTATSDDAGGATILTADPGGKVEVHGDVVSWHPDGDRQIFGLVCGPVPVVSVDDGQGGWKEVAAQPPQGTPYFMDGKQHGPGMCDVQQCGMPTTSAELAEYVQSPTPGNGWPTVTRQPLHGKIKVAFPYYDDGGCQGMWKTYSVTLERP